MGLAAEPTPTAPACVSGTFDASGGELQAEGASLEIPVDALTEPTDLELCPTDTGWEVLSSDLRPALALWLTIEHDLGAGTALFTPSPDGVPWRNLQATGGADAWTGPLYRAGQAYVAADPRVVEPYGELPSGKVDLLFVVDNSCSMSAYQAALADTFPVVSNYFYGSGIDFHVGVVSTDTDDPSHSGRLRQAGGQKWIDTTEEHNERLREGLLAPAAPET